MFFFTNINNGFYFFIYKILIINDSFLTPINNGFYFFICKILSINDSFFDSYK